MPRFGRDEPDAPLLQLKVFLSRVLESADYKKAESLINEARDAIGGGEAEDGASDPLDFLPARKPGANDRALAMDSALPGDRERAIEMVQSRVGRSTVAGCNTAAEVLRTALGALACDSARTLPASALPAMWSVVSRSHAPAGMSGGGSYAAQPAPRDPRAAARFAREYPEIARIRVL